MLAEKLVWVFPYTGTKNSNEFFGQPNTCWMYCSPKGNTFKSMGIYWASWYKKTSSTGKVWWIRGQIECGVPAGETGQKNLWCGTILGFGASLVAQMVKNLPAMKETRLDPWVGKIPWRKEWLHTPVFLPGEFHGWRSLAGFSSRCYKELDMIEQLTLSLLVYLILILSTVSFSHSLFEPWGCGFMKTHPM